jgi:hypothetical protein
MDKESDMTSFQKENEIFKKAWELLGEDNCFLCDKSLEQHIQETGNRFEMHCRTEYLYLMEAWNWKTLCRDCVSILKEIESQVLD